MLVMRVHATIDSHRRSDTKFLERVLADARMVGLGAVNESRFFRLGVLSGEIAARDLPRLIRVNGIEAVAQDEVRVMSR